MNRLEDITTTTIIKIEVKDIEWIGLEEKISIEMDIQMIDYIIQEQWDVIIGIKIITCKEIKYLTNIINIQEIMIIMIIIK